MKVLVLNCGSSSIKHRLFEQPGDNEIGRGSVEGIGSTDAVADHAAGLQQICDELGCEPDLVAHRVVHGGVRFVAPTLIDDEVLAEIERLTPLAPLHNPANVLGIRLARERFPAAQHVAVFDTAFHATMPLYASRYAIPKRLAVEHGVRRYGFHGSSHAWASRRAAELLEKPIEMLRTVVLHLGAGASACAVDRGRSVDTSMGMTPLEGLVMATRSGDLDSGVLLFLQRELGMSADEVDHLLNRDSGLRGYCDESDLREVLRRADEGDADAMLAVEAYVYRIAKYVGAYATAMGGLDAVVYTAGVGERCAVIRERVAERLTILGAHLDTDANDASSSDDRSIHASGSRVALLVVAANEELQIAREAVERLADA
ncbi:Acetate kinase [Botrimarina colliarenosi]|uniref:Acetate kinase n=1 Tax=Botrimarina colliarenosi TaxID=2528001 RepID=A0A5C6A627_9BACT|nr:acetate kinase [Botrimarina colliarenosi]TWT94825.1 Acetate kinase [Botrimarina colliarenosi]